MSCKQSCLVKGKEMTSSYILPALTVYPSRKKYNIATLVQRHELCADLVRIWRTSIRIDRDIEVKECALECTHAVGPLTASLALQNRSIASIAQHFRALTEQEIAQDYELEPHDGRYCRYSLRIFLCSAVLGALGTSIALKYMNEGLSSTTSITRYYANGDPTFPKVRALEYSFAKIH